MKINLLAAFALAGLGLGGCGYKPLGAPCSMEEGGGPAQSANTEAAPTLPAAPAENTVQALSYAVVEAPPVFGPFASAREADCGPLRPIDAGAMR
ncbi:hypothetical protein LMG27198_47480 [Methylocystis echinoides]|uniref:Lipoprotein n=1 Tax=Methylocystis echinoides TaxID=29468 RepID=A0A9W6GZ41_9HYPH|nr:hypothetical protein LMG27198_47480 [Methylocystis echinoides]